jgi:UDP-N-acetylglucosamine 4,6-dehydratase/5-epimerase
MFLNKKITITGGTGFWGQEFARQLLEKGAEKVVVFSRNECAQVLMKRQFHNSKLKFILGDIRDAKAINEACEGIDYVIHTAALKHGNKCEEQPREAVKTNIVGTQNVIDACIANHVAMCVNISSDKACEPVCFYGKTKAIVEGLITEANNQTLDTDFISIRSGNILGSSASVVPIWIEQIKRANSINLTGDLMRRFFITAKDAVKYTFEAMQMADRGEIFALRMPAFYITDLAKMLVSLYGNNKTVINKTGACSWERNIEWLVTSEETRRSEKRKHFYIIYPTIQIRTSSYPVIVDPPKTVCMQDAPDEDPAKLRKMLIKAGFCG